MEGGDRRQREGRLSTITDLRPRLCRLQLGDTPRADSSPSSHFTEEETETPKGVVTCLGSQGGFQWLDQGILVCTVGLVVPTSGVEALRR